MERVKQFLQSEDGGMTLVLFPGLIIIGMMLFAMMFNTMLLSNNKYHAQLMLDSATRSAVLSVDHSYAIKEKPGSGPESYHVYSELDPEGSIENAETILNLYARDMYGISIDTLEYNPSDLETDVWNSRTHTYDRRLVKTDKQFKNGNFSIRISGKMKTVGAGLINNGSPISINSTSQSMARGKVTGVH